MISERENNTYLQTGGADRETRERETRIQSEITLIYLHEVIDRRVASKVGIN
jgi:hypothetical protein